MRALQAAIDRAASEKRFLELESAIYEIYGVAGLAIPPGEFFVWRGAKGVHLRQFAQNAPILTIGDTEGDRYVEHLHLDGVRLSYADDQAGSPTSSALKVGLLRNSVLEQVAIFADYTPVGPSSRAYRGIEVSNRSNAFGFFSNTVRDVMVGGAVRSLLDISLLGTGSLFQNVYLTQGVTGHPHPLDGPALQIAGRADLYESVFEQLNLEWCVGDCILRAANCRGTIFRSLHLEGNALKGKDPSLMRFEHSEIGLSGVNVLDLMTDALPDGKSASASIIDVVGDSAVTAANVQLSWSGRGSVQSPLVLWRSPTDVEAYPTMQLCGLSARSAVDPGIQWQLAFDGSIDPAFSPFPDHLDRLVVRHGSLTAEGARIKVDRDVTVPDAYTDCLVIFPAELGSARQIVLSGGGRTQREDRVSSARVGSLVSVRRSPGKADEFPIIVLEQDGGRLGTIFESGGESRFRFDGRNWALVT